MRDSPVFTWLALFVLSAIGACVVWTRDEVPETERPFAILSLNDEEVARVRLETRARTVEFVRSGDSFRLIVEGSHAIAKQAPVSETGHGRNLGLDEHPLPAPSVAIGQRQEFPCNDRCREVFQQAAVFEATRDLGVPAAEDLAGFGLAAPEDALVVSTERGDERFALGKVLYGTSKRYARREADGNLYVVNTAFLEGMKSEGAYIDRRLHSFFLRRANHAVVRARGRELSLIRTTEFAQEALPLWAPVDRPEEENQLYGDWLRKTAGLYAADFPTEEAQEPSPALQIDYLRGEELLGTLELIEDLAEDEDSLQRYRARGENTSADVIVPRLAALQIIQDLGNLLSD